MIELKKVVVLMLLMSMLVAGNVWAYDVQLQPFKDEEHDYSREPIYTLSALGIINGYEDGTYRPRGDLSREAFIKLLTLAARTGTDSDADGPSPGKAGNLPADVAADRWSAPFIMLAYERGWIDSLIDGQGRFHPSQTITREEVAMLVGKALLDAESAARREQWLSADWRAERDGRAFKDGAAIDEGMRPYIYFAVNQGIMEGDPEGFKPKQPLIRKQAAAVVYRMLDRLVSDRSVDYIGFYAVQSYSAIDKMKSLSQVIFGWSHLAYNGGGDASLNTSDTVNRIPAGFEEAIDAANEAQIDKELMVFYDKADLKDFLRDEPAQQAFIESLLKVLNDPVYSFTGVNIDFEGLREAESAPDFVRFLQSLKRQLGNLTLSVAVPPVYYYKGYNLEEIGKLADTVILMAHDFTHHESRLPSAPLPLVNDTVVTALESIPAEKLVLGISKQANQWITANGVTAPPLQPAIASVESRLAMPGVNVEWTMPYFLTKATFTDERGSHELYYEDTPSIAKKIWLAKLYGLKGVSLWHMGHYTAQDWELIAQ